MEGGDLNEKALLASISCLPNLLKKPADASAFHKKEELHGKFPFPPGTDPKVWHFTPQEHNTKWELSLKHLNWNHHIVWGSSKAIVFLLLR